MGPFFLYYSYGYLYFGKLTNTNAHSKYLQLTDSIGESLQIIGDTVFQTNPVRLEKGMKDSACNGVLLKPSQVGTVWEAIEISKSASRGQWGVCGTRRGETDSTF